MFFIPLKDTSNLFFFGFFRVKDLEMKMRGMGVAEIETSPF